MQRPVDGHVLEVEPDDLVERSEGFGDETLEDARFDPFVTPGPYRRVANIQAPL